MRKWIRCYFRCAKHTLNIELWLFLGFNRSFEPSTSRHSYKFIHMHLSPNRPKLDLIYLPSRFQVFVPNRPILTSFSNHEFANLSKPVKILQERKPIKLKTWGDYVRSWQLMKIPTKKHKWDLKNVIFDWLSLFVLKKHYSILLFPPRKSGLN